MMSDYRFLIGSSTHAMKAKRRLMAEGIQVSLTKQTAQKEGCRYVLQVDPTNYLQAVQLLRALDIPFRVGQ